MPSVSVDVLRRLPFLRGASPDVVEGLAKVAVERVYEAGQVILQEGSPGREMYVIVRGLVEVVKGHGARETVLARRGRGEFFGEMGLFEASPRFATIRTVKQTRLLEFSERELQAVLHEQPGLLYQAIRVLIGRLRESDLHMISDLQRKNEELARAYKELQEAQAELIEKERIERELELAREIQQSILPRSFPKVAGVEFAARSQPALQVGGDFYDVIPLGRGRLGLVIADVSDKGMPAALYMALARSLIHVEAKRALSPRQVLRNANRLLLEISHADMFVTVFYAVFDQAQGSLSYARAGHDRPLILGAGLGECHSLEAQGMALGIFNNVELQEAEVRLHPGETLVLYTDGITDANSPGGEFFGTDRLQDTVCSARSRTAQGLCDLVFERVTRFQGDAVQHDDMAVLVMRIADVQHTPTNGGHSTASLA